MNKLVVILILTIVAAGCDFKSKKKAETKKDSVATETKKVVAPPVTSPSQPKREFKTKAGKKITIVETNPVGSSISDIKIIPEGVEKADPVTFKDSDPISSGKGAELADLDKDGTEELYIYTENAGSSSSGGVYAFTFVKNKKFKQIDCSAIAKSTKDFEGYLGHDSFKIKKDFLVRTFPVYKKGDTNASPTGGKKTIQYKLKGLKLVAEKK